MAIQVNQTAKGTATGPVTSIASAALNQPAGDLIVIELKSIEEVLKSKDIIEKFNAQGADPYITQPSEFASILRKDIVKWREVVKVSGAQID